MGKSMTYADAGVDINKSDKFIETIKGIAGQTPRSGVMGEIGGFGGLFSLNVSKMERPVLVSSTDGVGTKLKIAFTGIKQKGQKLTKSQVVEMDFSAIAKGYAVDLVADRLVAAMTVASSAAPGRRWPRDPASHLARRRRQLRRARDPLHPRQGRSPPPLRERRRRDHRHRQARGAERRRQAEKTSGAAPLKVKDVVIHPGRREVFVDSQLVELTNLEFLVLHFLAKKPGWVFSRYQIVEGVRGDNYPVTDRSVDVLIVGLRKKLGSAGKYIETVRGAGYRFKGE